MGEGKGCVIWYNIISFFSPDTSRTGESMPPFCHTLQSTRNRCVWYYKRGIEWRCLSAGLYTCTYKCKRVLAARGYDRRYLLASRAMRSHTTIHIKSTFHPFIFWANVAYHTSYRSSHPGWVFNPERRGRRVGGG